MKITTSNDSATVSNLRKERIHSLRKLRKIYERVMKSRQTILQMINTANNSVHTALKGNEKPLQIAENGKYFSS